MQDKKKISDFFFPICPETIVVHPYKRIFFRQINECLFHFCKAVCWQKPSHDEKEAIEVCIVYRSIFAVNRTIKRIIADYNAGEEVGAKKQHREAVLLPDFSAHHLRHTFCTRLCEKETNLKVIQSVMGHKDIQTTMDIYAEATEEKKQESFERLAATLDIF